jgi:hypothetical protein
VVEEVAEWAAKMESHIGEVTFGDEEGGFGDVDFSLDFGIFVDLVAQPSIPPNVQWQSKLHLHSR